MRMHYQERRALGCRVQLAIVSEDESWAQDMLRQLWLDILYFEKRCSRFLPDSELSQFNRAAGSRQPVSDELRDILLAARDMSVRTGGVYNPFVLPAVQRAGYVKSLEPGRSDEKVDDFSDRSVVAAERLEIGDTWASIPYGTAIDLGGCGKGYIGDMLAAKVQAARSVQGFWFSIGGDTILGGTDDHGKPWTLYLQPDPQGEERIGAVAVPVDGVMAVATSTTRFRRGRKDGRAWNHIIDPRTGKSVDSDLDLAVVCSDSLLKADVLATCLIIAGPDDAEQMIRNQKAISSAAWQSGKEAPLRTHGDAITAYAVPRGVADAV